MDFVRVWIETFYCLSTNSGSAWTRDTTREMKERFLGVCEAAFVELEERIFCRWRRLGWDAFEMSSMHGNVKREVQMHA